MLKFIFLLIFLANPLARADEAIVIGSKMSSDNVILGEVAAILLEEKFGQKVVRKWNLGGTKVAFDALKMGDIDLYPDYTGTGFMMILGQDKESDPQKVYNYVKKNFQLKWGIMWSPPFGFNNTYALAIKSEDPQFKNLFTISELTGRVREFKISGNHEFMERKDGHAQFIAYYNLNFEAKNTFAMESGLMYPAIESGQVDMIIVNSVDGRNRFFNLRLLKDDRRFFPPYQAALLAKKESMQRHPTLIKLFSLVESLISEDEMMGLSDRVDRLKEDPYIVASDFLAKKGLIQVKKVGENSVVTNREGLWGFLVAKREYLAKLLKEHLILSFGALILALALAFPTGVILARNKAVGNLVFPLINTIQTIPSLALLGFLIPLMGIGFAPALLALFLYSLLPLVRNIYTGILGVDPTIVEASKGIGLTSWQILWKVEVPLAMPVILSGLKTAAVIVVGTATLAALIGAGGLGDPIFRGVSTANSKLILLGAIPSALLAIAIDKLIGVSEKVLVSRGLRPVK